MNVSVTMVLSKLKLVTQELAETMTNAPVKMAVTIAVKTLSVPIPMVVSNVLAPLDIKTPMLTLQCQDVNVNSS